MENQDPLLGEKNIPPQAPSSQEPPQQMHALPQVQQTVAPSRGISLTSSDVFRHRRHLYRTYSRLKYAMPFVVGLNATKRAMVKARKLSDKAGTPLLGTLKRKTAKVSTFCHNQEAKVVTA
ncbi:hypothetical protein PPTG_21287 [Phytophthora nicotianae INRA-310]|uniref:Uncharacterized protein n=1 Tax=Phytophthora nicotianae (strain INRA-310) TaxID=761204 RepID=W2R4V3_PHYN3|nr:hypothetical protein PPTG_21287 [Phytophthora nicotianae INRA-310]ETN20393.1 hypothetical protein PPTG_21287 [Phytophthora nicotianae INRA-310]